MRGVIAALASVRPEPLPLWPNRPLHCGLVVARDAPPCRLALDLLGALHSRESARLARGIEAVRAACIATLPPLTLGAAARARLRVTAMHAAIAALPQHDRVPVLLACADELLTDAPDGDEWEHVHRALRAAQARVTTTEAHRETARRIATMEVEK